MIAGMDFGEFFSLVTSTQLGIAQKLRLQKIHRLAAESVGCPVGPAVEFEAELLVQKLKEVREQLKKTADLMEDFCLEFSGYNRLLTIPGFGPYIAARVLASISDPLLYPNTAGPATGTGHPNENESETGCQNAENRLDFNEETRSL